MSISNIEYKESMVVRQEYARLVLTEKCSKHYLGIVNEVFINNTKFLC